jgi:hypothetical protein
VLRRQGGEGAPVEFFGTLLDTLLGFERVGAMVEMALRLGKTRAIDHPLSA